MSSLKDDFSEAVSSTASDYDRYKEPIESDDLGNLGDDSGNNKRKYKTKFSWIVETGPSIDPLRARAKVRKNELKLSDGQRYICDRLAKRFDGDSFVDKMTAVHATSTFTSQLVDNVRAQTHKNYFLLQSENEFVICSSPNETIGYGGKPIPGSIVHSKNGNGHVVVMIDGKAQPTVKCEAVCDIKNIQGPDMYMEKVKQKPLKKEKPKPVRYVPEEWDKMAEQVNPIREPKEPDFGYDL